MLFYFPHWLWKTLEDRKLDKITNGLRGKIRRQMLKSINYNTLFPSVVTRCKFCAILMKAREERKEL